MLPCCFQGAGVPLEFIEKLHDVPVGAVVDRRAVVVKRILHPGDGK